jgi:hypothetical protein
MGSRLWIDAIAGSEDPIALAAGILDAEIVANRRELRVALPPLPEHALGSIRALNTSANAAPDEMRRGMVGQQSHNVDLLRPLQKACRARPVIRPV